MNRLRSPHPSNDSPNGFANESVDATAYSAKDPSEAHDGPGRSRKVLATSSQYSDAGASIVVRRRDAP